MSRRIACRVKKLKAFSETQIEIFISILRNYCLLNEGATNKLVFEKINTTFGAHGFNLIIYQLVLAVIKDCYELLFDKHSQSPSAYNIINALEDKEVYDYFLENFSSPRKAHWPDGVPDYIKDRERDECKAERIELFEVIYKKCINSYFEAKESELIKKVKRARNKVASHFEVKLIDDIHKQTTIQLLGLEWDDVDAIVRIIEPIIFDLHVLVTNNSFDSEHWAYAEQIAQDFWNKFY